MKYQLSFNPAEKVKHCRGRIDHAGFHGLLFAFFFVAAFVFEGGYPLTAAPLIIENGQPKAEIVISESPMRSVKLAAKELQEYLRKITGAELPITTAPGKDVAMQIYVGRSAYTDKLGVSDEGLNYGAFRIISGDNWLVLLGHDTDFTPIKPYAESPADIPRMLKEWDARTGAKWGNPAVAVYRKYNKELDIWDYDERGSFNAVTQYLRNLGVRWYMPGELGEIVPQQKTIALSPVNQTVKPDFEVRDIGSEYTPFFDAGPKDSILWRLRLGLSPGYEVFGCVSFAHTLNNVHSREEVKLSHPEYYALYGEKRAINHMEDGAPCLSSQGLVEDTVKFARAVFDIYNPPMISVMPNDGYANICECDLCKQQATPERGNKGSMSDYVWNFVNRVAIELYKTNPDKKVLCIAYGPYTLPPEKIKKFSPNVVVGIVQPRAGFYDAERKGSFLKTREGFLDKLSSKELYIWEHYLHSRPGSPNEGLPSFFPHLIVEDLRSLKGISKGDSIELSQGPHTAMHAPGINHLNVYITARFYWDVNQNLDAILEEYFSTFYGPAAQPMKEFYTLAESHWWNLEPKDIKELLRLFDVANKAAGNSIYGERIALLRKETEDKLKQLYLRKATSEDTVVLSFLDEKGIDPLAVEDALPKVALRDVLDGTSPAVNTAVSLGWTGDALFLRIVCEEPEMNHLRTLANENDDTNIFNDDSVEIVLKTPAHSYFQFTINADGKYADLDRGMKGLDGIYWDADIKVRTEKLKDRWIAWVRIPATALKADPPTEENPWYLNVGRVRLREQGRELAILTPSGRLTFHDMKQMTRIYFPKK